MNIIKKSVIFIAIILVFILFSAQTVFASSMKSYDISELELSISVPSNMTVYTRTICENEQLLVDNGYTYDSLISQFKTNNIYFNALDPGNNQEIVVTMTNTSISDFNLLGDTVLDVLANSLVEQYKFYNISEIKHDIYQHSQAKFIRVYFYDIVNNVYGLQYYTNYNNRAMNITLRSYDGTIDAKKEDLIKKIVDSVKYSADPKIPDTDVSSSFQYTDSDTGVFFTVPDNWIRTELSQNRQYLDAKFSSTIDGGTVILYGSTDLWSQMDSSEKQGITRTDVNSSCFSKQDIVELLNCSSTDVTELTYGEKKYYQMITQSNVSGSGLSITMTMVLCIDDGWMYLYQFSGTPEHKLFSDFVKLLNSVHYPCSSISTYTPSSSSFSVNTNQTNNTNDNDNGSSVIWIIVLLIVVILITITIVLYNKNQKTCTSSPINDNTKTYPNLSDIDKYDFSIDNRTLSKSTSTSIYCHKCGSKLPIDSEFCYRCGTKQINGDQK